MFVMMRHADGTVRRADRRAPCGTLIVYARQDDAWVEVDRYCIGPPCEDGAPEWLYYPVRPTDDEIILID